jgi:hypothetical protein
MDFFTQENILLFPATFIRKRNKKHNKSMTCNLNKKKTSAFIFFSARVWRDKFSGSRMQDVFLQAKENYKR